MSAVCPGSFDPITFGHLDVIARAAEIFGEVVVAVGKNSAKDYLFDLTERVSLVEQATAEIPGVTVAALDGLLVDFAAEHGVSVIVKGLRFASDFDFELQMAHINQAVGSIPTVMLPASSRWSTLSSTMIREVASLGGDVSSLVPAVVADRIAEAVATRRKERLDG